MPKRLRRRMANHPVIESNLLRHYSVTPFARNSPAVLVAVLSGRSRHSRRHQVAIQRYLRADRKGCPSDSSALVTVENSPYH
jgi:hypothetical protein